MALYLNSLTHTHTQLVQSFKWESHKHTTKAVIKQQMKTNIL